jgi:hypothetical protein
MSEIFDTLQPRWLLWPTYRNLLMVGTAAAAIPLYWLYVFLAYVVKQVSDAVGKGSKSDRDEDVNKKTKAH